MKRHLHQQSTVLNWLIRRFPSPRLAKPGLILAVLLASGCGLWATDLVVSQDSYIEGLTGSLDSNFGGSGTLYAGQSSTVSPDQGGRKSYLLFDASALPEITEISSFTVRRNGGTINRTIQLYAILGDNVDTWTETGITWNNAPGNNVTQGLRDFGAYPGESLIYIGNINTGADSEAIYTVPFSGLSGADYQNILDALNTGDRKLTLGLKYNSSQASSIAFRSKEYGDGSSAAFLSVTLIPEPSGAALLLGGLAGLVALRRR